MLTKASAGFPLGVGCLLSMAWSGKDLCILRATAIFASSMNSSINLGQKEIYNITRRISHECTSSIVVSPPPPPPPPHTLPQPVNHQYDSSSLLGSVPPPHTHTQLPSTQKQFSDDLVLTCLLLSFCWYTEHPLGSPVSLSRGKVNFGYRDRCTCASRL